MVLRDLISKLKILDTDADLNLEIRGISYDSRKTEPGDLFVAISGFESDGHKFIAGAAKKGAVAVLCEKKPEIEIPYVLVEDCRLGLALASCEFFGNPASGMKVIGVTGTSGKTTTTHLIKHVLEEKSGSKVGLIGTNGNMIGDELIHTEHTTPESYELQHLFRTMADKGCKYVVMEVSSHSLALERVAGINFSVAAYTNLSEDHLDFHPTMDAYAAEKKKLFYMCDKACVNLDDEYSEFMLRDLQCEVFRSSILNSHADIFAENIKLSESGVSFEAVAANGKYTVSLAIPGMFSVHNALTVISCCTAAGISIEDTCDALATASGVKGRVEYLKTNTDYSVIIDYSHKPDALEKVLKTLRPLTKGRLICLFGCGGDRDRKKRPIMASVSHANADFTIITSDNPRTEKPEEIISEIISGLPEGNKEYIAIIDRVEAIHWAIDNAHRGDVILLAGKGHEDYQVIGHEKYHMDEREIVADYLRTKESL